MLEQEELALAQRHASPVRLDDPPGEIQRHVSSAEELMAWTRARLSEPRPDPGDQLGEREGLREVVGGAELQAPNLGLDVGERRKDKDALVGPGLHQALEDGHPVQVRQQQV